MPRRVHHYWLLRVGRKYENNGIMYSIQGPVKEWSVTRISCARPQRAHLDRTAHDPMGLALRAAVAGARP